MNRVLNTWIPFSTHIERMGVHRAPALSYAGKRRGCGSLFTIVAGSSEREQQLMKEIERKFLLPKMPEIALQSTTCIRQGYISKSRDSVEIRLRRERRCIFHDL